MYFANISYCKKRFILVDFINYFRITVDMIQHVDVNIALASEFLVRFEIMMSKLFGNFSL